MAVRGSPFPSNAILMILIGTGMGAAAPNPGHTFPVEGKYAKVDRGVLRIPPSEPHNAPLLGLRPAAQASPLAQDINTTPVGTGIPDGPHEGAPVGSP